ncbi:hypothetical protein QR98_0064110, partial [Sarcoptes scabiei]
LDSSPIDAFIIGNRAREHFNKIFFFCISKFFQQKKNSFSVFPQGSNCSCYDSNRTEQSGGKEFDPVIRTISHTDKSADFNSHHHQSLSQTSSNQSNRDSNSSDLIVVSSSQSRSSYDSTLTSISNSFKYAKLASESAHSIDSSLKSTTKDSSDKTSADEEQLFDCYKEKDQKSSPLSSSTTSSSASVSESEIRTLPTKVPTDQTSAKMELVELSSAHPSFQMHREMPVDVPDSFVAVVKQTPRYPPPHPPPQPPQRYSSNDFNHAMNQSNNAQDNQISLNNRMDKYRKYSDEIQRKKEEEEFLRSSLRSSKKLQQLQESNKNGLTGANHLCEPMVNIAFEPDDELMVSYTNAKMNPNTLGQSYAIRNDRESDKVLPFPYLEMIVENIRNSLNPEFKDLIDESKLKNLVSIYSVLMQHQHSKINSFLDSQQTLRPPSYNSIARPAVQNHIHPQNSSPSSSSSAQLSQQTNFSKGLLTFPSGQNHHPSHHQHQQQQQFHLQNHQQNNNNSNEASESLREMINTLQQNVIKKNSLPIASLYNYRLR